MFTKKQISKMKEEEFQNTVLIPLFRGMKFNDVKPFGGGVLERGKDIIMWKEGELKERINFGVVVKVVKVTGKAIGNGSAAEVLSQIRQTLTSRYFDPVTTKEQKIDFCWVVSSKEILKEAIFSIESQLKDSNLDKNVRFIDENNLYQLIEEYLPEQSIFEQLSVSQKELDELMKDAPYRIVATTENEFIFKEKPEHPVKELPVKIELKLNNDQSKPDFVKAKGEIEEHLKTGKPVEIEGDFIKFEMPHLPEFMKPADSGKSKLILNPIRGAHKFPISIEAVSNTGDVAKLDYLDLESIQQGTEEITFNNENQKVPWQVKVVMNFVTKEFNINFKFNFEQEDLTLRQELLCLRFLRNFQKGGKFTVRHLDLGLVIYEGINHTGSNVNPPQDWINLLERLVFIEEKAKVTFYKNNRFKVPTKEANHILAISKIIESGKRDFPDAAAESIFPREATKTIIEKFKGGYSENILYISESMETDVWGIKLDLGKSIIIMEAIIIDEEIAKIEEKLEDETNQEIEIKFQSKPDTTCEIYYLKWLSQEQESRLKQMVDSNLLQSNSVGIYIKF